MADAYFNINRKSRSEKDLTIINLLPVKKGQTLAPSSVEDSSAINSALVYLNNMKPFILNYAFQKEILSQQEKIGKLNTKLIRLKNDSGDIDKKIRRYQQDLKENNNDQVAKKNIILSTATGDNATLAKAHKKMNKLLDKQSDLEKRLRNSEQDANKNIKEYNDQHSQFDKENQTLEVLKLKLKNLVSNP